MTFEIFYGPFPVKTIYAKVELGALNNRDLGPELQCLLKVKVDLN